jgi:hypothetical protein
MNEKQAPLIFMKVGNHAGESWDEILTRKRQEYEKTGQIFWGYGGGSCHPLTQVQPFARLAVKKFGSIYLVMEPIESRAEPEILPATEYSPDGVNWLPMPEGISVLGSRFALVLDEIKPHDLELRLEEFEVGVGPSRGKSARDYLTGRIDKACLHPAKAGDVDNPTIRTAKFAAELKEPYAVLLRSR